VLVEGNFEGVIGIGREIFVRFAEETPGESETLSFGEELIGE